MKRRRTLLGRATIALALAALVEVGGSGHGTLLLSPPPSEGGPKHLGQVLKTGTTIAGVVCGEAVVLAADTR